MTERFIDMVLVLEDAAYIRQERLAGDPERDPDETTEEDVIEAMLRRKVSPIDIIRNKGPYTHALRIMLKGIDQQR